jgi:hypothetical protein
MSGSSVSSLLEKYWDQSRKYDWEKNFVPVIVCIFVVSFLILIGTSKLELLPSVILGCITAIFAFCAYKYTKEKFRLELFEKRWEVYRNIAKFCSNAAIYGDLSPKPDNEDKEKVRKEAYDAMGKSFKGEGYHLRSLLFSNDMEDTFEELNQAYAFLSSHYLPSNQPFEGRDHLLKLRKIYEDLPNLFKPYLYFGDYRKND